MPTLIEHYKLDGGSEWAVLADGGSGHESMRAYICVPLDDLGQPAEDLGKAVTSLGLAAEAVRLKCMWLNDVVGERGGITLLEIINRNLDGKIDRFSKVGANNLLEATSQQTAFQSSIKPYPGDTAMAKVSRWMEWHPMIGLKVMLDLKQEIESRLREEYFELLRLRASRPKRRLTPAKGEAARRSDQGAARMRALRADRRQSHRCVRGGEG